jgi:hypothetical protein
VYGITVACNKNTHKAYVLSLFSNYIWQNWSPSWHIVMLVIAGGTLINGQHKIVIRVMSQWIKQNYKEKGDTANVQKNKECEHFLVTLFLNIWSFSIKK